MINSPQQSSAYRRVCKGICPLICLLMLICWSRPCPAENSPAIPSLSLAQMNQLLQKQPSCTLVAFLAAWCIPCIEELPDLVHIHQRYQRRGLNVIGISIDFNGPHAIMPLLAEEKVDFPVYWAGRDVTDAYRIVGIPLLLLVEDGKVIDRIKGKHKQAYLNNAVEAFLGICHQKGDRNNPHQSSN